MEEAKQRAATAVAEEEEEEEEEASVSLKDLSRKFDEFARERDWEQYHNPRNLLLAMVRYSRKEQVGKELFDVLLYLIRLSDACGIDLGDAARKKIVKITTSFWVERFRRSGHLYAYKHRPMMHRPKRQEGASLIHYAYNDDKSNQSH
ncbi:uncharacterized protein LOC122044089 [Zingiber officinale]|uniref:uncharacterized protein LOC122044089 n=1 Tax=Zingiber officinale TaxID=94328 RepID=UPI001C4AA236|nr:uncharacterized protein LOC122044089 [Zingiber officinale]